MRRVLVLTVLTALGVAGTATFLKGPDDGYVVEVVMPTATNLVPGSQVEIDGFAGGEVESLAVKQGKAVVTVNIADEYAPLPDGTRARIAWKAVLGERVLELVPGPEGNPMLPTGAMVEGTTSRVELDQVLGALDPSTRQRLKSLLQRADGTLAGREGGLNATVRSLGPTLHALGQVLEAVGNDGPAIRSLVARTEDLTSVLAQRDREIRATVQQLSRTAETAASRRQQLSQVLGALPPTLVQARTTLDAVPATVDRALPLLQEVRPATNRLPAVARRLTPVMAQVRPTVAQLRPTLVRLASLLRWTPRFLDGGHAVLPGLHRASRAAVPALSFLRPYTPEAAGWLSNWSSAAGNYDSNSHYLRAFVQQGGSSMNHNPGAVPPGLSRNPTRYPGENEGQPWTDAHGSEMR